MGRIEYLRSRWKDDRTGLVMTVSYVNVGVKTVAGSGRGLEDQGEKRRSGEEVTRSGPRGFVPRIPG